MIWTFDLTGDRDITEAELDLAFTIPAVYEGEITPEYGGGRPVVFHCDLPADSLATAVRDAEEIMRQLGVRVAEIHSEQHELAGC